MREKLLEDFKLWLENQKLSKDYVEKCMLEVKLFLEFCGDSENIININPAAIEQYAVYLDETQNFMAVCRAIVSVKSFYDFLYSKGGISEHPFERVFKEV